MVPMMYPYAMVVVTLIVLFVYTTRHLGNHTTYIESYWKCTSMSSESERNDQIRTNRQLQTSPVVGQVETLRLINANTDLTIVDLVDGMIINIATQSTSNFNIQAVTSTNGTVGSVRFQYNNITNFRTESSSPFAFCGDQPTGNYRPCNDLVVGQHNISATPYTDINAKGTKGGTKSVSFRIVNIPPISSPLTVPVPPPLKSPTKSPTKVPTKVPTKAPTKAPTKGPTKAPVQPNINVTCNIPKFTDTKWYDFKPDYPLSVGEAMGLLIGNDMMQTSGFINNFQNTTNVTFVRDMTMANSTWRRMDDMPLPITVTHAGTVLIGSKVYMCGGYLGGHPGPHIPYCQVYDHSIPPGSGLQWSRFADLPLGGFAGGGMIYDTIRNALYYAGGGQRLVRGSPHPVDYNYTWKYSFDNTAAGWVASTPIPYKANHLSSITVLHLGQERHYFVGGQIGENEARQNLPDLYEFIASNETWVPRTFLPTGRGHTTSSTRAIGCGFMMAGGSVNSATSQKNRTSSIVYYHIPSDNWTFIGDLPNAGATPLVDIHSNGYMYFVNSKRTSRRRITA